MTEKTHPETRYWGKRISQCGHQPVYKQLLPDGEPTELSPAASQRLRNHSPDGFQWGSLDSFREGKFSYEFCGDSDDTIVGSWNFMEIKDVRVEYAYMDDVERHLENPGESYLLWNVSLEFYRRIHQYSFAIKSSDKINKELVAISRHIGKLDEALSRQVSISGNYLGKPTSLLRILTLTPFARCSPHFSLEAEPIPLNPKMFILTPPIVTVLRAENMLERASCFAIDGIRKLLFNPPATLTAKNLTWHMLLVSLYLYNSISIPTKTRGDGSAQLALALLLDVTGNYELTQAHYQDFKFYTVASWGEEWQITSQDILDWISRERRREFHKTMAFSKN